MNRAPRSLQAPLQTPLTDENGLPNQAWLDFFVQSQAAVEPLGLEKYFSLVNNQASEADIEGLKFNSAKVGAVTVDYLIQRITTGGGAQELVESGTFNLNYLPTSDDWAISNGPTTSGITLTVTDEGQVQYTSTNITGTHSISKLTFRARTMAAKNHQYSVVGR